MTPRLGSALLFPVFVTVAVSLALLRPGIFGEYRGHDLKLLIVPLIQIIMFGMGTKLSVGDFLRVFRMPWPVFVGVGLHYTVMPVTGYLLAKGFGFPPGVAAGVILVGSVSSGAASNLIAYLSGANVALAVTVTACSTLVSPFLTPLLMKTLAGRLVPIDFMKMFLEILNMVLVPVVSGLMANRVLRGNALWWQRSTPLAGAGLGAVGLGLGLAVMDWHLLGPLQPGAALGLVLFGLVALAKLVIEVFLKRSSTWLDRVLPAVSMLGICLTVAIITSRSRERLLNVGGSLILAAILHNAVGYLLGYYLSRAVRLDKLTSRTLAIEVGMQNAGMASGLAMSVLKSAEAALAPALFGPWMNISGAVLAGWWRRRPIPGHATVNESQSSQSHP